jgi:HEAT repeat protein
VLDWLRGSSPASRRVGLRQLKQVGALPSSVIDDLIFLLSDADQEIRLAAMETLGSATVLPENALTTICRIAMDTGSSLRLAAVNALRRPEMLPPEVINYLIQWSYDPTDVHVRRAAIQALGECKNATPDILEALMERLEDPIDAVRSEVMEPLAAKGKENARTRHMLAHAVSDSVHRVRCAVASALRHYPRPDQELQFALRTLLNDSQVIVREAALDTVASLEDPGRDLIDYVVRLVNVQDFGIGARAVSTLASLRDLPYTALLALVEALPIHWETEGRAIADCLKAHHPLGMEIIHRIMDLAVLRNVGRTSTSRVPVGLRALALEILGYALDEAPDIVGVLVNVARDSASAQVQMAALRGLGLSRAMRPEAKVVLIDLLHHGPPNVRCAAGIALASLIHNLPDPPLNASEIFEVAKTLASLLEEITPRASWEKESQLQNDLLQALHRVVARSRPAPPRLGAGLE